MNYIANAVISSFFIKKSYFICLQYTIFYNYVKFNYYISSKFFSIRGFVYVTSCCKQACFMSFDERSQRKIYDSFYANKNKQLQDTFLIACVNQKPINRAVIMPKTKNRQFSWEYFFICEGRKINVCKQFLIKLVQISEGRMKTVLRFCQAGKSTIFYIFF